MASFGGIHSYSSALRPPVHAARDSTSCAITRGSVYNDMVAFRSQHDSAGPGIIEQQFATTKYPATKVKLTPREGVTPAWNEEFKNLISQCRRSHILIEDGPPTLHRFLQEAPSLDLQLLRHMQAKAVHEWQRENTDVFYILRNSVNLEGPHNKADLAMLEQNFRQATYEMARASLSLPPASKQRAPPKRSRNTCATWTRSLQPVLHRLRSRCIAIRCYLLGS